MSQLSAGFRRFSPVLAGFRLGPFTRVLGRGSLEPAAGSHFAMDPLRAPETIRISTMAKTLMDGQVSFGPPPLVQPYLHLSLLAWSTAARLSSSV